jgi:hypothetical protein
MSCRHLDLRPLPRPFTGTEARCRLADERTNPRAFVKMRETLAQTGQSAGLTCPYAADGLFAACAFHESPF